jgi:HK97 family phage major capsid protein
MSKNVELRGQRAELLKQADAIVSQASQENRNLTTEELNKFEAIEKDANNLKRQYEILERNIELQKEQAAKAPAAEPKKKVERTAAFEKYLRFGMGSLNAEERQVLTRGTNSQVAGTDSLGGYGVPEGFSGVVDVATEFTGELERIAGSLQTAGGNLIPYPTVNDTATDAGIKAEAAQEVVQDMTFGVKNLSAYTYSTLVKVSDELLQDAGFDLSSFLVSALGERIARATNADFTNGDGSSKPSGLMAGATLGKEAASATAITSDEILDLIYSIDKSYRNSSAFGLMMADSTVAAVRALGLSVNNDFPVFVPSMQQGEPDRIFGIPVFVNNDMAAIATGNKAIVAGDMNKFLVRSAGGVNITRINEAYRDSLQVGFMAHVRKDSVLLNGDAVKYLALA